MKFAEFLKRLFTQHVPLKLLALACGFACALAVFVARMLAV